MNRLIIAIFLAVLAGCDPPTGTPKSSTTVADTGVKRAHADSVQTGTDGLTVEQRNIKDRLKMDNTPGSIKHLYIISAFSGQTLIYSTVKGKVTSSGKRLTPGTVISDYLVVGQGGNGWADSVSPRGQTVDISNQHYLTSEVIQDDGTYGSSIEYLYWWDVQGKYHQHYCGGGQIVHISDQPLQVRDIVINMELTSTVPATSPVASEKGN